MNMWDIASFLVEFSLTVSVSLVAMWYVIDRWAIPMIAGSVSAELKEEYETAERAIKTGMSAMGTKSAQMKDVVEIEGMLAEGLLSQYPEAQFILDSVNPELYDQILEKLTENPELIHILYERWGHLLGKPPERSDREKQTRRFKPL